MQIWSLLWNVKFENDLNKIDRVMTKCQGGPDSSGHGVLMLITKVLVSIESGGSNVDIKTHRPPLVHFS